MEYQVPQFIEVEDKIVGPLTLKQFIYIAGGAGLCVICFAYLPIFLAIALCIPIVGLAGALAFYTINGKPFVQVLEAGFTYYTGAKMFLWRHQAPKTGPSQAKLDADAAYDAAHAAVPTPKLTHSKLSDLAWSLDVPRAEDTPQP